MNEVNKPAAPVIPELSGAFRSLQAARDARNSAAATTTTPPDEEQRALNRLDKLLNNGDPIRGDVPRGYYFNVRV
ncbi:MAG: hypothetical protein RIB59_14600 [Rhodospirillales bacterium]